MIEVDQFTTSRELREEKRKTEESKSAKYETYKYRWAILVLFILVSFSSAFQWPMYMIIGNVMEEYYGVSLDAVSFTATVFLVCYVILIYPATYLLQKFGLRFAVIVAAIGPCIASIIKLLSLQPDRFWVILLGQAIIGSTQTYLTFLPTSVAAAWFGPNQVSTACSIASIGIQLASAFGSLIPTLLLGGKLKKESMELIFGNMNIGIATFSTAVLLLVIFFFKAEPPTPPSETRSRLKETKSDVSRSVREIVKDAPFILYWLSYSCHVGILYSVVFLLTPTVQKHYPDNVSEVGAIALLCLVTGVAGSTVFGIILDKFKRFKATAVLLNVLSTISISVYTGTLGFGIVYVYIFQTLCGFFMTAEASLGLEVGAEITYPFPESVSSGILVCGSNILGFVLSTFFTYLFTNGYGIWTHVGMSTVMLFVTVLTIFIPFDLKRQAVNVNAQKSNVIQ